MRKYEWFELCKYAFGCVCETMPMIVLLPQTTLVPREDHVQVTKGRRGRPGQDRGKAVLLNLDLDLARLCDLDLNLDLDAEIQSCSCLLKTIVYPSVHPKLKASVKYKVHPRETGSLFQRASR